MVSVSFPKDRHNFQPLLKLKWDAAAFHDTSVYMPTSLLRAIAPLRRQTNSAGVSLWTRYLHASKTIRELSSNIWAVLGYINLASDIILSRCRLLYHLSQCPITPAGPVVPITTYQAPNHLTKPHFEAKMEVLVDAFLALPVLQKNNRCILIGRTDDLEQRAGRAPRIAGDS